MDRECPDCGDRLTPLVERDEKVPVAGGTELCSSCQLAFTVDATNALIEVDPYRRSRKIIATRVCERARTRTAFGRARNGERLHAVEAALTTSGM